MKKGEKSPAEVMREVAAEIESGKLVPGASAMFNFEGSHPVCTLGHVGHRLGSAEDDEDALSWLPNADLANKIAVANDRGRWKDVVNRLRRAATWVEKHFAKQHMKGVKG